MNSLQGGWGIQDRHDRVITWLSGIVVCLLVLYALIFVSRQFLSKGPDLTQVTPTPQATSLIPTSNPLPPLPTRTSTVATRPPVVTYPPATTRIPTRTARLPDPVTRTPVRLPPPTPRPRVPPTPSPSPRPVVTRLPSPTPVAPTRVANPLPPPPTRTTVTLPTARPVATSRPANPSSTLKGPYYVRAGGRFSSGSGALTFARRYDVDRFKLVPETNRADSQLFLHAGPFQTQQEAMSELERLRRRVRDPSVPLVIRGKDSSTAAPAPTRVPDRPTLPRPPVTSRPLAVRPTPVVQPLRPVGGTPAIAEDQLLTVGQARDILVNRYSWSPPNFRGFTLQVASFRTLANAVNFRNHLAAKGYEAYLDLADVRGGAFFRVLSGVYDSPEKARESAAQFEAVHGGLYKVFVRKHQ